MTATSANPAARPGANHVELSGVIIERGALRYTPAGVAMLDARLAHQSETIEAGRSRQLEFEVTVKFAGALATRADQLALGQTVLASGFLASRRRQSRSLVLHITAFSPSAQLADPNQTSN